MMAVPAALVRRVGLPPRTMAQTYWPLPARLEFPALLGPGDRTAKRGGDEAALLFCERFCLLPGACARQWGGDEAALFCRESWPRWPAKVRQARHTAGAAAT
jgi:hypothetical protein